MSDPTLITLFTTVMTALPPSLLALAAFLQSMRNDRRAAERTRALDTKIDTNSAVLVAKTDEIHTLTNGNLARVMMELSLALSRIVQLEDQVKSLTVDAAYTPPPSGH